MIDQEKLSKIFRHGEKHRLEDALPVEGWASNRHGDKDSLWNAETKEMWERDHPDGDWYRVPPMGSDEPADASDPELAATPTDPATPVENE